MIKLICDVCGEDCGTGAQGILVSRVTRMSNRPSVKLGDPLAEELIPKVEEDFIPNAYYMMCNSCYNKSGLPNPWIIPDWVEATDDNEDNNS